MGVSGRNGAALQFGLPGDFLDVCGAAQLPEQPRALRRWFALAGLRLAGRLALTGLPLLLFDRPASLRRLGLWACGRQRARGPWAGTLRPCGASLSEGAVIVVVVLLLDVPRAPVRLHPVPEEVFDVLGIPRFAFVIRGQEALGAILPGVVLHQRPLRIAGEASPFPESQSGLHADDRQGARILARGITPRKERASAPVVMD